MPITAYSHRFAAEMDVAQWLSRVSGTPIDSLNLDSIDNNFRRDAADDLECPSCGTRGAILVSAGTGKRNGRSVRQAAFRFHDPDGGDPHDPLCDFAGGKDLSSTHHGLIDLQSKDWLTREVRRLVCAGIAAGVFTQADMRGMRLWFLERRRMAQISVTLDPRLLGIAADVWRWSSMVLPVPFAPAYGDIPGFDWNAAARRVVLAEFRFLHDLIRERRQWPRPEVVAAASSLAKRLQGVTTFDSSVLAAEFTLAESLVDFMLSSYGALSRQRRRCYSENSNDPRAPLLTIASLLLFVSDWDLPSAAESFARLASVKIESDVEGNLMGLNPFTELRPIGLIRLLQEVSPQIDPTFTLSAAVAAQVDVLQRKHEAWVLAGRASG